MNMLKNLCLEQIATKKQQLDIFTKEDRFIPNASHYHSALHTQVPPRLILRIQKNYELEYM